MFQLSTHSPVHLLAVLFDFNLLEINHNPDQPISQVKWVKIDKSLRKQENKMIISNPSDKTKYNIEMF